MSESGKFTRRILSVNLDLLLKKWHYDFNMNCHLCELDFSAIEDRCDHEEDVGEVGNR
jgi:hypothetical protein